MNRQPAVDWGSGLPPAGSRSPRQTVGGRRRRKGRGLLLYLLSAPLLLKAILSFWTGDLSALAVSAAAFGMFLTAASLIRRDRGPPRRSTRRHAQIGTDWSTLLGSFLTGSATALTVAGLAGESVLLAVLYGLAAATGAFLVYHEGKISLGSLLRRRKADALSVTLDQVYANIDAIEHSSQSLQSLEFRERIGELSSEMLQVTRLVEQKPEHYRRARKFLTVYVDSSRHVVTDYEQAQAAALSPELEHKFRSVLVDLQNTCAEQRRALEDNDLTDLDVRIEVLTSRLRREGIL
jgi:hypothetical protein